jgi:uncharacterized protein YjbI with pentapeptide repeats
MQVDSQKLCLNVRLSDLSGSRFDDVNFSGCEFENVNVSGWRVHNANLAVVDARLDGATIEGVAVTEILAYWREGHAGPAP